MTTMTIPSSTGHFAMFQIVTAWSPSPTASPIAWATGPLTARMSAPIAVRITLMSVTSSIAGRSSPDRASLVDLVHPVHRAAERPDVARGGHTGHPREAEDQAEAGPLVGLQPVDDLLDRVRRLLGGTSPPATSTSASVVLLPCPNTPSTEMSAMSAGKIASTAVVGERRGQVGALVVAELPSPCGVGASTSTPACSCPSGRRACAGPRGRGRSGPSWCCGARSSCVPLAPVRLVPRAAWSSELSSRARGRSTARGRGPGPAVSYDRSCGGGPASATAAGGAHPSPAPRPGPARGWVASPALCAG